MKYIFVLFCMAVIAVSCSYIGGKRVRGNGQIITQDRQVKDFKGVKTAGFFDVYITTGNEYSVKVEADENLLEYIETEVDGDNLRIRSQHGFNIKPSNGVKVYVTAPVYNKLSVAGSGNISGKNEIRPDEKLDLDVSGSGNLNINVRAENIESSIAGSGTVTLSGETNSIKSSIAGSGDLKAEELKSRKAVLKIAGSGTAHIDVAEELNANVAGSGDVRYTGNPRTDTRIAGSGTVKKVD